MEDNRYFLVTHKYRGDRFRAVASSKNRLKKSLPRFNSVAGEYMSMWDIEEVDEKKYRRMKHLRTAPDEKEY